MDVDEVNETLAKKEYQQLFIPNRKKSQFDWNENFLDNYVGLVLHTGQIFARNWINVNNTHTRILLKHETGTGKTIAQVATAMAHIKFYKDNYDIDSIIYIIGFSEHIIKKELLGRKEFGFITADELKKMHRLQYLKNNGSEHDYQVYKEFKSMINRRLKKKYWGGYFQFMGYKEFYNRMFLTNESMTSEEELFENIKNGNVEINWNLVKTFTNALIICDEIHNVYNGLDINNYGIAIKFILNLFTIPEYMAQIVAIPDDVFLLLKPNFVKLMMTSATPINNKSTEIVDLINILVPATDIKKHIGKYEVIKSDLFNGDVLKPNAKKMIADLIFGYISYLSGKDPEIYPEKIMIGKPINGIKYLKFIKCQMSPNHKFLFNSIYNKADNTIPLDSNMIDDIIIPDPNGGKGLYQYNVIQREYQNVSTTWLNSQDIRIMSSPFGISGGIFKVENIGKYSGKYKTLLDYINTILSNNKGKIYINHQKVKSSGVLLIEQILLENGFIDEYSQPVDNTKCSICGIINKLHGDEHNYMPARYSMIHGNLQQNIIDDTLLKYNAKSNIYGHEIKILLGSKKTNEGIDFNCIQHVFVLSVPKDISTLIQIIGRAVRNKSHIDLPENMRKVSIYLLICTDHEINKYREKSKEYLQIQQIEMVLNSEAIDSHIHRNIIEKTSKPDLGALPFTPTKKIKDISPNEISLDTFHFYINDELYNISYIIKRLFIEQSDIWQINDLWNAVVNPPFKININGELFNKNDYYIVINNLLWNNQIQIEYGDVLNLMDYNQKILPINGENMIIVMIDDYLLMVPLIKEQLLIESIDEHKKISSLGTELEKINGIPNIKLGRQYVRKNIYNITKQLKSTEVSYSELKLQFFEIYAQLPISKFPTSLEIFDLKFHQYMVETVIKYIFSILTDPNAKFSEFHEFYFKLIYFYDRLNLIIYADHLVDYPALFDKYTKYIDNKNDIIKDETNYNRFLQTSIINSQPDTNKKFDIGRMNDYLYSIRHNQKKKKEIIKTSARLLPVGHFINTNEIPFLYNPVQNIFEPTADILVSSHMNETESDIIVGYYTKSQTNLKLVFKLKIPSHKLTSHRDARLKERGIACQSKTKKELFELANQLNIENVNKQDSVKKICETIKLDLLSRELHERRLSKHDPSRKKIRWFYLQYENHL